MKRMTLAAFAAVLMVASPFVALSQAGTGSNAARVDSVRTAERNDGLNWGWLGLLGLGGLAGLMRRDRPTKVWDYSATSTNGRV